MNFLVSKIIFLFGIITVLLGVVNSTIRPSESYDTSAKFNNKFSKFEYDLDLEVLKLGGLENKQVDVKIILELLSRKNDELFKLVAEYNEAGSLRQREADIETLNQKIEDLKKLANIHSTPIQTPNGTSGNESPIN
ncbi:hypothetical protein NUACC21_25950 [Scytonema sp. NUACC21]